MGLTPIGTIFLYEELKTYRHIEQRMPYEDWGRDWSYVYSHTGTPGITGKHENLGDKRGIFPRTFSRVVSCR